MVGKSQNLWQVDNTYKWHLSQRRNIKWKEKNKEKGFEITENEHKLSIDNCNLKLTTQNIIN